MLNVHSMYVFFFSGAGKSKKAAKLAAKYGNHKEFVNHIDHMIASISTSTEVSSTLLSVT